MKEPGSNAERKADSVNSVCAENRDADLCAVVRRNLIVRCGDRAAADDGARRAGHGDDRHGELQASTSRQCGDAHCLRIGRADRAAGCRAQHAGPPEPVTEVDGQNDVVRRGVGGFATTKSMSVFVADGTGVVEPLVVSETRSPSAAGDETGDDPSKKLRFLILLKDTGRRRKASSQRLGVNSPERCQTSPRMITRQPTRGAVSCL